MRGSDVRLINILSPKHTLNQVTTIQDGTNPLGGTFTLTLDVRGHTVMSANAVCTTGPIRHNAWASAEESDGDGTSMEEILEATDCVGDVSVTRSDQNLATDNGGYAWFVTFLRDADSPCQQYTNDGLCNSPGDVPKFNETKDDETELLGTSMRNLVYGDGDSTHGAITALDAADNATRPPGAPEVQTMRVYDLELTASNKFEANPGFVLSFGENTSSCILWDASAETVAEELSRTSPLYGKDVIVSVTYFTPCHGSQSRMYFKPRTSAQHARSTGRYGCHLDDS